MIITPQMKIHMMKEAKIFPKKKEEILPKIRTIFILRIPRVSPVICWDIQGPEDLLAAFLTFPTEDLKLSKTYEARLQAVSFTALSQTVTRTLKEDLKT